MLRLRENHGAPPLLVGARQSFIASLVRMTLRSSPLLLVATLAAGGPFVGETGKVGGDGGSKLLSMDCGTGGFIVGVAASGGRDGQFGFNLVRKIRFIC